MTRDSFLQTLRERLYRLPEEDREKSLAFYAECIDDRIEEGLERGLAADLAEAEAVAALGDIDDIVREIESALPMSLVVKQRFARARKKRQGHSGAWIVLALLGSPIWLPLLIAAFACLLSLYIAVWAVIASLYAALLSVAVTAVMLAIYGTIQLPHNGVFAFCMATGAALVFFGLVWLLQDPLTALSRWILRQTARLWRRWKRRLLHQD